MSKSYAVLYTRQKTQKRKKWNDGKLTVHTSSGLIHLFPVMSATTIGIEATPSSSSSNSNSMLDTLVVTLDQVKMLVNGGITDLEMEKFLIEIESEWKAPYQAPAPALALAMAPNSSTSIGNGNSANKLTGKKRSNGMQKLLSNKYRKPAKYVPKPNPNANGNSRSPFLKRKRPLQPGKDISISACISLHS